MFITVHHTFIRGGFMFITHRFFTIPSHLMNMTPFINEGDAPPDERGDPLPDSRKRLVVFGRSRNCLRW